YVSNIRSQERRSCSRALIIPTKKTSICETVCKTEIQLPCHSPCNGQMPEMIYFDFAGARNFGNGLSAFGMSLSHFHNLTPTTKHTQLAADDETPQNSKFTDDLLQTTVHCWQRILSVPNLPATDC